MNYTAPDVYVKDVVSGASPAQQASSTIGVMLGVTRSGLIGEPQLISSFTEFIELYANGLDSPYINGQDLSYSVRGFYENGGKELYIVRVASKTAKKSKVTMTKNAGLKFTAKYEGTAGDLIGVTISKSEDFEATTNEIFDVSIEVGTSDSATINEVTFETIVDAINANQKAKEWLVAEKVSGTPLTKLEEEGAYLAEGNDGIADLTNTGFIDALETVSVLDDVSMLAVPGKVGAVMDDAIMSYCDNHKIFPFLDMPAGSAVKEAKDYRKSISAKGGILAYPWGKMNDPLTNELRTTPSCGHTMGVYVRTITERGVHKAPAGVDARIRGFVAMERKLTQADVGQLNAVGVVCITSRPNAGLVIWGARALTSDPTMRYVSDVMINYNLTKTLLNSTQFAVFEPNDPNLWSRVKATCQGILETMRLSGALKGTADEAYYVQVDEANNTDTTINNGYLNIMIMYAPVKPAEFIVIKLSHTMES